MLATDGCEVYTPAAGLVACVLWCSCPYILGHGSLLTSDVPASAMGMAAVYCFWRWLRRPWWLEATVAGLAIGLAELCKFTLLVLYPILFAIWLVYRLPERKTMSTRGWLLQAAMLVIVISVSVCTINFGYLFESTFTPLGNFRFQTTMFTGCESLDVVPLEGANRFAGMWLARMPVPLPANFVQGIDTQRYDFERGLPSYLRGEWASHGWWHYYLYALLIKMPLGTWVLVGLAVGVTVWEVCRGKRSGVRGQGSDNARPLPSVPLPKGENRKTPSPPAPLPKGEGSWSASWRDEMVVLGRFS